MNMEEYSILKRLYFQTGQVDILLLKMEPLLLNYQFLLSSLNMVLEEREIVGYIWYM
nr:MAG TPA: hypothetical protein [Caudoviricetes sp.]